jgi:V/A-type H+-transporting ATPase subunit I
MLKPETITRIRIIAHKDYYDALVSALQDAGVMQIEPVSGAHAGSLGQGMETDHARLDACAQRFRSLESMLLPVSSGKRFSFESTDELFEKSDGIKIDGRVIQIRKDLEKLSAETQYTALTIALLERIDDFTGNMSVLNSRNVSSFVIYGKERVKAEGMLGSSIKNTVIVPLKQSAIVSIAKERTNALGSVLEGIDVKIEAVPELEGSVIRNIRNEKKKLDQLASRNKALMVELEHISREYYPIVSAIREQLDIEMDKIEASAKFGSTEATVAVEGWTPVKDIKKIEDMAGSVTKGRYLLQHIKTDEPAPTKMHNPKGFRLFEAFIKFYSLPKSTELDPTVIFALVFPLFFGLMVGDAGYGAVMLLGALWLLYRSSHIPKKSHLPKGIARFVTNIVSPDGLKVLAKSLIPGSLVAMAFGIIFNEYFGFHLWYSTPFSIEQNLSQLIVLSGWIGVSMVAFGFLISIFNNIMNGNMKHAAAKAGWLLAMAGLVMFGLSVLHRADLGIGNSYSVLSYLLIGAGLALIAVFEGAIALMELPSLISHILSYTRLIGILLASVILAEVIDFIFVAGIEKSLLFGIVGIAVLLFGQLFNIIVALFEPGIQGARLFYVEFFSKFYEGNGNEFRPFANSRKRTVPRLSGKS